MSTAEGTVRGPVLTVHSQLLCPDTRDGTSGSRESFELYRRDSRKDPHSHYAGASHRVRGPPVQVPSWTPSPPQDTPPDGPTPRVGSGTRRSVLTPVLTPGTEGGSTKSVTPSAPQTYGKIPGVVPRVTGQETGTLPDPDPGTHPGRPYPDVVGTGTSATE